MNVVTLRVHGFGKRKDFHFTVVEEAAKFQKFMEKLDENHELIFEVLSSNINTSITNIRELAKRPETYAEKAYKEIKINKNNF